MAVGPIGQAPSGCSIRLFLIGPFNTMLSLFKSLPLPIRYLIVWFSFIAVISYFSSNPKLDYGSRAYSHWRLLPGQPKDRHNWTGLPCCAEVWVAGDPGDRLYTVDTYEELRGNKVHKVGVGVPDGPDREHLMSRKQVYARSVDTPHGKVLITRYHLMDDQGEIDSLTLKPGDWSMTPN